jgi:hypothetical protein
MSFLGLVASMDDDLGAFERDEPAAHHGVELGEDGLDLLDGVHAVDDEGRSSDSLSTFSL